MNYTNPYVPSYGSYYAMPQQQQFYPQQQQTTGLQGKLVDGIDVVRAMEVPINGFGVFPKADLSEIYIKSWNNNGTTSILTFKPEQPAKVKSDESPTIADVLTRITAMEAKIDEFLK